MLETLEGRDVPVVISGLGQLPSGVYTFSPTSINDSDAIAGLADSGKSGSLIWQAGGGLSRITLNPPNPTFTWVADHIDNSGNLAGYFNGPADLAFRDVQGDFLSLTDGLVYGNSYVLAVNVSGIAVGWGEGNTFDYKTGTVGPFESRAFRWGLQGSGQGGDGFLPPVAGVDLGLGDGSVATAISNSGLITGTYFPTGSSQQAAFVYQSGAVIQLPNSGGSKPVGISDDGTVVATAGSGSAAPGVLWKINPATGLYAAQSLDFVPKGMNNHDVVVGNGAMGPVAWSEASGDIDLNGALPPNSGWQLISAVAINGQNEIVGTGFGPGAGNSNAYLLTGLHLPTVTPTTFTWSTANGGVDYNYQVSDGPTTHDIPVALYWASGSTFDTRLGKVTGSDFTIPSGKASGTYMQHVDPSIFQIQAPPAGSQYLLLVVGNPTDSGFNPSKDVKSLAVPNLVAKSLDWHTNSADGGGVDLNYDIDLATGTMPAATIALYWAHGTAFDRNNTAPYNLAFQTESATAAGSYHVYVKADQLKNILDGTGGSDNDLNLLLVVDAPTTGDPQGAVLQLDQTDDVKNLKASPKDIVPGPAGHPSLSTSGLGSPEIIAVFQPAGGALTLAQAAQTCGVDHFNWLQVIKDPPSWVREIGPAKLTSTSQLKLLTGPAYDPIVPLGTLNTYYVIVPGFYSGPVPITLDSTVPDPYPPYLNEIPAEWQQQFDPINPDMAGGELDAFTFVFKDRPEMPLDKGSNPYGSDKTWFYTKLVGMDSNHDIVPTALCGISRTTIVWSDNAVYDPSTLDLSGGVKDIGVDKPLPGFYPPITSGGVTAIQVGSTSGPATTSFVNLSAPAITYGQGSTTISGHLHSNVTGQNVLAGETVQVTLNGVAQDAALDSNDDFSTAFDTSGLVAAGSPYTIGFSYAGDGNFTSASAQSTLTVKPQDLASQLHFWVASYSVPRTAGSAVVSVVRTGGLSDTVTVQYASSDGSAKAGTDYTPVDGTLTFGSGVTTQTITVPVLDDHQSNGDETVILSLSSPTGGATLDAPSTAVLTINDPLPQDPMPGNLRPVANALTHSAESYALFVTGAYRLYLKRAPDPVGLAYWVNLLQYGGLTDERLEAEFLGSPEYIQDHGGTGAGWVRGMYQDLLGRDADAQGLAYLTGVLAAGGSPSAVAYGFAASPEREAQRIGADYQVYLGRPLDPGGLTYWVNQFLRGARNEDVVGGFVGSPEYYTNPNKGQGNRLGWIQRAYLEILQRAASSAELNYWNSILE
jgi:hypothetical protein